MIQDKWITMVIKEQALVDLAAEELIQTIYSKCFSVEEWEEWVAWEEWVEWEAEEEVKGIHLGLVEEFINELVFI